MDAGSVAVAAGLAQRLPDGSVVFHAPAAPRAARLPAPERAWDGEGARDGAWPRVQAQSVEFAPPAPPEPAGPPPEPPPASAPPPEPPAAAGPAPGGPQDEGAEPSASGAWGRPGAQGGARAVDDELVRALLPPLSRMLKAELRIERERSGFLLDTRH
ncbi:hypothetical protein [Streptomyces hoynatensis]|uniref:hypothetical protein n=1 Tax=Streptomyces hoynatensis TaxID=1141874 RepID=UPI0011C489E8|nr:hypothetical protein [Streptomyces hoynatensis]